MFVHLCDGERSTGLRFPAVISGEHLDLVRNEVRGVKPHPELADETTIGTTVVRRSGEGFHKLFGAGVGNHTQALDHLVACEPDTVVFDRERPRLFVRGHANVVILQVSVLFLREYLMARFIDGVRRVADKFA